MKTDPRAAPRLLTGSPSSTALGVLLVAAVAMTALTTSSPADAAGVYRWTDSSGQVHYSDKRATRDARRVTLTTLQNKQVAAPSSARDIPAEFRANVELRCGVARERKAAYDEAGAVFDNTATGVTYQLSGARRAERLQQLSADISTYCSRGAAAKLWAERAAQSRPGPQAAIPADARRVPISGRLRLGEGATRQR